MLASAAVIDAVLTDEHTQNKTFFMTSTAQALPDKLFLILFVSDHSELSVVITEKERERERERKTSQTNRY